MTARIEGLTYEVLDEALRHIGFERRERNDFRSYKHRETGAFIAYPKMALDEMVTAFHFVSAQQTLKDAGIMDEHDFDLLLVRLAGRPIPVLSK